MGPTASITIADDATVAVGTGCNTGSGTGEVTDTTLVIAPLAAARRACPGEANPSEAGVLTVLQGEVTYEISANTMPLRSGGGADEIGLDLTAEA